MNNINNEEAGFISEIFLYFINKGLNPYFSFLVLILLIFLFYFLILYQGGFKKLTADYKKLTKRKKIELIIFLLGGIFIAYILFYFFLPTIISDNTMNYQFISINNFLVNFWDNKMLPFLLNIGLIK